MTTRDRNRQLEVLLVEYGYSHRQLADEVTRQVQLITGSATRWRCTDRHIRRWISGEVRWPWNVYLLALQQIFGRTPQAMGFVPRGRSSARPAPPPAPTARKGSGMRRRRFVTASVGTGVAAVLGIEETPQRGRLGWSDIARIRAGIDRLDSHFLGIGGGAVQAVAVAYIEQLRGAVDGCTYGERVERALHAAISSLYASAGWAAYDTRTASAADLHAASLQHALMAADPAATARAWSNLALEARLEGRDREAVQITRTALEPRRARQDPHIAAVLYARLAIGQARLADGPGSARSLLAAQRTWDRAGAEPPAAWLAFLSPAELAGLAGLAHRALGDLDQATTATREALTLLPPAMRRQRAVYSVQLADIQHAHGDTDGARATLTGLTADVASLDTPSLTTRATALRRALATT